jgi:hypothetical protein
MVSQKIHRKYNGVIPVPPLAGLTPVGIHEIQQGGKSLDPGFHRGDDLFANFSTLTDLRNFS